ncbi:putative hydroxyacid-oxoacid transhydrogenase [Tropilaelaps mercedesae]|uniref:hydroxyacid-oxoacid transhydrogenase n=1 Tax=Tropilaelaps mercedesae TaxID=418985 RepID=A0A1V9XDP5_9ACAR|nr:putative hydroxyacid-oxoacid transhydrogenase [Tropilaelaps mercedesae]
MVHSKFTPRQFRRLLGVATVFFFSVVTLDQLGVFLKLGEERSLDPGYDYPLRGDQFDDLLPMNHIYDSLEYRIHNNTGCKQRLRLAIFVKTALAHRSRRNVIRRTDLIVENEKHRDIIQVDFVDGYYNNTLKTMSALRWATQYCRNTQYFLLIDDDYYLSVKNLLRYIAVYEAESSGALYVGTLFPNATPMRHRFSRWFVSLREYPYSRYPAYVTAGAVLLNREAAQKVYSASKFTKHFVFDDIFVAICARKARVEPRHSEFFQMWRTEDMQDMIAVHGYVDSDLEEVWMAAYQKGYARRCPGHHRVANALLSSTESCSTKQSKEYAFEMACSNIRYGPGVTQELGQDIVNLNSKKVCVVTDKNLEKLPPVRAALDSLHANKIVYELFSDVAIEPTDHSFKKAINFARAGNYDAFVAVGGGSVIDTAKAANLYAANPDADFLDFVNAPIGKGLPVRGALKPFIAIPTTAGTGSETTGVAIFDYEPLKAKTGIASRSLKPTLALVDPLHVKHMPERVAAFSGFDVLCHALESFTAVPFNERKPRPDDPIKRPAYQGSNPISDVWAKHVFGILRKFFKSTSSNVTVNRAQGASGHAIAHRILQGGRDIRGLKQADAGLALADVLREYMANMKIENGLSALGFSRSDVDDLVKGTLPQERVTKLSPRSHVERDLADIFEQSMTIY